MIDPDVTLRLFTCVAACVVLDDGFEPDNWILMGGLASLTLAGDRPYQQVSGWLVDAIRMATKGSLGQRPCCGYHR